MLWGKGGQYYKQYRVKFDKGVMPPTERIVTFLELEQAADIKVLDLSHRQNNFVKEVIILTGYSPRHLSRIRHKLIKALSEADVPGVELVNPAGQSK
jgi:ribosomal silencing factor RsfS